MKRGISLFISILFILAFNKTNAQGLNSNWLIGSLVPSLDSNTTSKLCRINFFNGTPFISPDARKMKFRRTQANISDANGSLLMSSNGFWIADASGDTMQNGSGLAFHSNFTVDIPYGYPFIASNLMLPFPGDTSKYVLFHQMGATWLPDSMQCFYSIIDMSLNNGLGAVISKNNLLSTMVNVSAGIGACKHGNGRDWWVFVTQDNSNLVYKILLTPTGISSISSQTFSIPITFYSTGTQPAFSPDGLHYAISNSGGNFKINYINIFDFDRCTGNLSNLKSIFIRDSLECTSLTFSPNSKYLYFDNDSFIYQLNVDSLAFNINYKKVATYDGYTISGISPTNFYQMYRAIDGKIYVVSRNAVTYLNYINYPDSADTLCDVRQHSFQLPSYNFGTVPNHPNYYLGPVENSGCDTLSGIKNSYLNQEQILKVVPNPSINGAFGISYVLGQNQKGLLQVFDINGKKVHEQSLPQWSTFQQINVPNLANGIYSLRLQSGNGVRRAKVVVLQE
ncbi:MAG: T9SS type A sorting domain-containing protein [Bacteroidetes bacterium]|nr:T9SS type A sorting domain-containing protein [Bacteroidota bacterium]